MGKMKHWTTLPFHNLNIPPLSTNFDILPYRVIKRFGSFTLVVTISCTWYKIVNLLRWLWCKPIKVQCEFVHCVYDRLAGFIHERLTVGLIQVQSHCTMWMAILGCYVHKAWGCGIVGHCISERQVSQSTGLDLAVPALSYVDDTDLLHKFCDDGISDAEFVAQVQWSIYFLAHLLPATGGNLKPTKCSW